MRETYDESIGYPTVLTGRKIVHLLHLFLRPYGITPEQWTILRFLAEQDGITQKQLSHISGKDQPTVTRILDIMDREAWIERRANSADRRSFLIFLTEKGKRLFTQLRPIVAEAFLMILDGIREEELTALKRILHRMNDNIEHAIERLAVK